MKYGRHIEILEWITNVTENLQNGMITITVVNKFRFTFDKKTYNEICLI